MRYSSDNQRQDSIIDQRRNIVQHLDRLGINYDGAIELSDEAMSGTRSNRPGYQKLIGMVEKDEVRLVMVDDLSRLTRRNDLGVLWDKLAIHGCRLISVLDGIDSSRESDEMGALLKGIMNNVTNKLHGRRVRRGIAGRALDKFGSAGDHPFGYASRYCNQNEALNYSGIGPKPKKEVYINEAEAQVVREIYRLFVEEGWSMTKIAQHMNSKNTPTGKRSKLSTEFGVRDNRVWLKTRIRRLLEQRKYTGDWRWGENVCKKTDKGGIIKRPADPKDIVRVENPELAIISKELWDKAQVRLAAFQSQRGYKFGQKKRGPQRHYTEDYPNDIVGGMLYCGKCGRRLYYVPKSGSQQGPYFRCPNAVVHGNNEEGVACDQKWYVRKDRVVAALSEYLRNHLLSCDGWLDDYIFEAKNSCIAQNTSAPDEIKRLKDKQKENSASINNIMAEIERGGNGAIPGVLLNRLQKLDADNEELAAKIHRLETVVEKAEAFPTDEWIKKQLVNMAEVFADCPQKTAKLFRQFFGKVFVMAVVAPGKTRGHSVISFTPNNRRLMLQIANLDETLDLDVATTQERTAREVSITLSGYDKIDKLIPTIEAMRQAGIKWKDIGKELGVSTAYINIYYNKWKKLTTEAQTEGLNAS